jgi:hypothetical protein
MTVLDNRPTTGDPEVPADLPAMPGAHIYRALREVMAEVRGFPKTGQMLSGGRNPRVQYTFQRWDDMAAALGAAFRTHGVATRTVISNVDRYRFEKSNYEGKPQLWTQTSVVASFIFVSLVDGSELPVDSAGEALDNSDKGVNKAITAAYKNACKVAFTLSTDDDQDPDATRPEAVGERVRNAPRQNGQPQQPQQPPTQHQPPPEPVWAQVQQLASGQSEFDPEPSRLEIARKGADSIPKAKTSGDLAQLAAWYIAKGAMSTEVDGTMLARRFLAALGTLPVGPPSRDAGTPMRQDGQQGTARWADRPAVQEPSDHGGY